MAGAPAAVVQTTMQHEAATLAAAAVKPSRMARAANAGAGAQMQLDQRDPSNTARAEPGQLQTLRMKRALAKVAHALRQSWSAMMIGLSSRRGLSLEPARARGRDGLPAARRRIRP